MKLTEVYGIGMDVVPNITNCPIPVLIPCRTHQSCWKRYCCRTEHTDVSGTGSTGGVYIGREDNGRRVKTPFPYPSTRASTPAMSNRLRCCRCRSCLSKELADTWASKLSWLWWTTMSFARLLYQWRHSSRPLCSMPMCRRLVSARR